MRFILLMLVTLACVTANAADGLRLDAAPRFADTYAAMPILEVLDPPTRHVTVQLGQCTEEGCPTGAQCEQGGCQTNGCCKTDDDCHGRRGCNRRAGCCGKSRHGLLQRLRDRLRGRCEAVCRRSGDCCPCGCVDCACGSGAACCLCDCPDCTCPKCPRPEKFGWLGNSTEYEVFRDVNKHWRWRLKSRNNQIIANSGEGYANRADCDAGISLNKQSSCSQVTVR